MNETPKYATVRLSIDKARMTIILPPSEDMEESKFRRIFENYIKPLSYGWYDGAPAYVLHGTITINKTHRKWVVEQLRYLYDGVWEYREYGTEGKCDTRCQKAEEDECVCSCKGEFHQGGGDWKYHIGTTLIGGGRQIATSFYESFNWQTHMSVLPTDHPVRVLQPLAPAEVAA